jgi:hypothetical protein
MSCPHVAPFIFRIHGILKNSRDLADALKKFEELAKAEGVDIANSVEMSQGEIQALLDSMKNSKPIQGNIE